MYRENDFRQYLVMKRNNKVIHTKRFKNDLTPFPDRIYISSYFWGCSHEVWYEDYLVDIVFPAYYFKNSENKEVVVENLGKITEFDEPVVVLLRLKEEYR